MSQPRSHRATIARRVAIGAGLAVGLPLLGLLGVAGWFWVNTDVPPPGSVQNPQASVIRFADGTELGRLSEENRTSVPLNRVSLDAQHAVLAAEDRGFYEGAGSPPGASCGRSGPTSAAARCSRAVRRSLSSTPATPS